jgi:hypothetical protein
VTETEPNPEHGHDPDLTKNIGRLDPGAPEAQRPADVPDEVWPPPNPGDAVADG